MVTDSAALVMFAIRSAVKLSQQARLAYVDSTRRRQLVLPLPHFEIQTNEVDAVDFFVNGSGHKYMIGYELNGEHVGADTELAAAVKSYKPLAPDPALNRILIDYHTKYRFTNQAEKGIVSANGDAISADSGLSLLTVQQWRRGYDPTPSTLRRIGGTLVEIGIDYALTQPDLFDPNTARGKAIRGFLEGLDDVDFKENEISELPVRLFTATLDAIGENPELISGDSKIQELLKSTTVEISKNVKGRLYTINEDGNLDAVEKRKTRLHVQDWAQLIFRTTLSTGGRLVINDPGKFLGIKTTGDQALVTAVGGAVLDTILDDETGLRGVLSRKSVETIMRAALDAIGEHPEILTSSNNKGIKQLISSLATGLSQAEDLLTRDILPEVVRMTIEKTGENLPLFWPDLKNHPEKNLLATAAAPTLKILGKKPTGGAKWKLKFSKEELLAVTEATLDQFLENPAWLIDDAGEVSETLKLVLETTIGVLRKRADKRLSATTAIEIIQASLKAVALRQEFVHELPNGKLIITAAVDTIIAGLFKSTNDPKASWQLLRAEVITGLTTVSLEALAD